jgi:ribulose-phosphate 3-epimerase
MAHRPSRQDVIGQLRQRLPVVLPSLLLCDFANLEQEVRQLEAAGVAALHFDVMDGQFVPNITYGMPIVASLRDRTQLLFDVHLMIEHPDRYVEQFYAAGADVITIHAEAVNDPRPLLDKIRKLGAVAGLAIDTPTDVAQIEESLELSDLVLTLSVPAGFGGQSFHPGALQKLRQLKDKTGANAFRQVDGGVNPDTIASCVRAGADLLVVGSAIFRTEDYTASVQRLTEMARTASAA